MVEVYHNRNRTPDLYTADLPVRVLVGIRVGRILLSSAIEFTSREHTTHTNTRGIGVTGYYVFLS